MSIKENTIPIFLATDDYYAPYASVAIQSIIDNRDKNKSYSVYVLNSGLSKETIETIKSQSKENISISCVDISEFAEKFDFKAKSYFSVEMFYRILIPDMFKEYDKVIYIDCDLVCQDDLSKLYNIAKFGDGELLCACVDCGDDEDFIKRVGNLGIEKDMYINSGVLVMNCKKIREEDTFRDIEKFLKENKNSCLPDQDAINHICKNRIKIIDTYWNIQTPCFRIDRYKHYIDGKKGILHFTGINKPWDNTDLKMSSYFWDTAKRSPFYEIIEYRNKCREESKKSIGENIDQYFNRKGKFTDKIIIISAKDEASKKIKNFKNKSTIGIEADIKFRDSYVCVVDVSRNKKFEKSGKEGIKYSFTASDKKVDIISCGFKVGNRSSIKINGIEISHNKRGLNFVVLNAKTLAIVDTFFVDSYGDDKLIVRRY